MRLHDDIVKLERRANDAAAIGDVQTARFLTEQADTLRRKLVQAAQVEAKSYAWDNGRIVPFDHDAMSRGMAHVLEAFTQPDERLIAEKLPRHIDPNVPAVPILAETPSLSLGDF